MINEQILMAVGVFIALLLVMKLVKLFLLHRIRLLTKKTKTDIDDVMLEFVEQFEWPFLFFISIYISLKVVAMPEQWRHYLDLGLLVIATFYFARGLSKVVSLISHAEANKRKEAEGSSSIVIVLGMIVQVIIWIIAVTLLLSIIGINVTSLIAGLGIGGIAIAFALQRILEDIFSSFSIYFDKPFEEGDFIVIGEDSGTVEKIGIKTTRIRHLKGHELVVSNRELTTVRINNYKKMQKRRIIFTLGLTYDTPRKKLEKVVEIISDIVSNVEKTALDRVHFKEFGSSSLNFEVVYYVDSSDYKVYMDIQQQINLKLIDEFAKEKIDFAFPTQTIYLAKP